MHETSPTHQDPAAPTLPCTLRCRLVSQPTNDFDLGHGCSPDLRVLPSSIECSNAGLLKRPSAAPAPSARRPPFRLDGNYRIAGPAQAGAGKPASNDGWSCLLGWNCWVERGSTVRLKCGICFEICLFPFPFSKTTGASAMFKSGATGLPMSLGAVC